MVEAIPQTNSSFQLPTEDSSTHTQNSSTAQDRLARRHSTLESSRPGSQDSPQDTTSTNGTKESSLVKSVKRLTNLLSKFLKGRGEEQQSPQLGGMPGMPSTGGMPGMPQSGGMPGMPSTGGMPGMPQSGGLSGETAGGMPGMPQSGGMPGIPQSGGPSEQTAVPGIPGMPGIL